tara:strand:- start:1943 stop:2587 length:645 start_codon:yes stop_codon:yes gene_type:complete
MSDYPAEPDLYRIAATPVDPKPESAGAFVISHQEAGRSPTYRMFFPDGTKRAATEAEVAEWRRQRISGVVGIAGTEWAAPLDDEAAAADTVKYLIERGRGLAAIAEPDHAAAPTEAKAQRVADEGWGGAPSATVEIESAALADMIRVAFLDGFHMADMGGTDAMVLLGAVEYAEEHVANLLADADDLPTLDEIAADLSDDLPTLPANALRTWEG